MKLGLVGLPNAGKSTLFNAVMQASAEAANYPFSTINPNVGMVPVMDERLNKLYEMYKAKDAVPAVIEMVDIAGLIRGSGKGEGLGNRFLSHIREVDAIIHVVRCFGDENVPHIYGGIHPLRDIEIVNLELIFSDLEMIERRLSKVSKSARTDKSYNKEAEALARIKAWLEEGKNARDIRWEDTVDLCFAESLNMLTQKPVLYAANISEGDIDKENKHIKELEEFVKNENSYLFISCAKIEAELVTLPADERKMFLDELGLTENSLARLVNAGYELLGLISFFTVGPKEVRARTLRRGIKAQQAAGKVHSDMERGFIRAEIIAFDDLMDCGSYSGAKEKGLVRIEGKEYVLKDGDVMLVRFNV